jgi:hypothetical protein
MRRRCALGLLALALGACTGSDSGSAAKYAAPGSELTVRAGLAGRLTPAQHRNVVSDVLGFELGQAELAVAGGGIPQEQPSTGLFRNGADGQAAADDYPLAFGRLAAVVAEGVDIEALLADACAATSNDCALAFVTEVGKRLFRRPLSERERAAFTALHGSLLSEQLSFEQACRSVLEAMLQAPAFVFRLEQELAGAAGEKRYLDGFELASRLAFFLWDSAPDDELLALAELEELHGSPSALPVLRQQIKRLLVDPRARRMTRELVRDFAGTERAAFIGVTPELRGALLDSMVATVDQHLWHDGGQIRGLFTTTRMSFDPRVAALLGLSPLADGQRMYDVSQLPERVGWLTHPGFIAGLGDAQVGKIVHRGITLMVKLLCRQPVQLPDGLEATTADFNTMYSDLTERQRSEQRQLMARPVAEGGSDEPSCWGCHSQFEPLAYGFDRFDAAGRYLGAADAQGRALPIDGWLTDDLSIDEAARPRYADVPELMALLAESEAVQACMAQHFLAFATGRASSSLEQAFAQPVHAAQLRSGGTLHAMVESVATSELFRALAATGPAPAEAR